MSDNNENKKEQEEAVTFQAGEKGFAVFWFLFGLFFFVQSMKLLEKNPGISSAAAVPLFCSGCIIVCALIIMISDRRKKTPNSGRTVGVQVKQTLTTMFPKDIVVMIAMILLYCIGLYVKLGFYVCTPVFLWCGMTWFMRERYMKNGFDKKAFGKSALSNLMWTVICILFILVMFTYLFRVVLP